MRTAPKRMFPNGLKTVANTKTFDLLETTMEKKEKLTRGVAKKPLGMIEKSYYDRDTGRVETVRIREERAEKQTFRNRGF